MFSREEKNLHKFFHKTFKEEKKIQKFFQLYRYRCTLSLEKKAHSKGKTSSNNP